MQADRIFRYPARDEVFFVQNAGAPAAGTGLNKSSIIQKISLSDAEKVRNRTLKAVPVTVVNTSNPQVINPNGGTFYNGNIIFAGEGQGDYIPSALYVMNPEAPYNTTSKYSISSLNKSDIDMASSCQQLFRPPIQLFERPGYPPQKPRSLLHRHSLRLPPGLPSRSWSTEPGVPLQLQERCPHGRCRRLHPPQRRHHRSRWQ